MTSNLAPRITKEDIEAQIVSEHYFTAADGAAHNNAIQVYHSAANTDGMQHLGLLTFCVLVLRNGFTVVGNSACASPANFNADLGNQYARENAIEQMWPLLGYELKTKLAHPLAQLFTAANAQADDTEGGAE